MSARNATHMLDFQEVRKLITYFAIQIIPNIYHLDTIYLSIYLSIYIYIYTHRKWERKRERERDRDRDIFSIFPSKMFFKEKKGMVKSINQEHGLFFQ